MEKSLREKITAKLSKIKVILAEDENTEEKTELEDVRKVDGTLLRVEPGLEVGATVQVIGEDAELIAAPDGDHELEDGSVLRVEGGVISEVILVEAENVEEEMSEEEVEKPRGLDVEALTADVMNKLNEAIVNKIAGLKFEETVAELKAENAALKETIIDVVTEVEKFADTPKEKPVKTARNPFRKEPTKTPFSKLLRKD